MIAGKPADVIELRGLRALGYHGVYAQERERGQEFVVDLLIETDFSGVGDDLAASIDYSAVADEAIAVVTGPAVDLIETLAERICAAVLAHPRARAVEVTVHKPHAPLSVPFADVAVRIRRPRRSGTETDR